METFITLCLLFILGGSCGWVLELFFRRFVHKKWINPGFLTGPCLPLYGVGVVCLYLICSIDYSFIENDFLRAVFVVAVITAAMTLIEYITGLIFIKGMKVQLWDYSDRIGNIQGIICPLFTFFWGIVGAIYFIFLHPLFVKAVNWISYNEIYSFFIGAYFGVFVVDACYSFNIVTKIRKWAAERDVVVKYEEFKLSIKLKAEEIKQKYNFLFSFKAKKGLSEALNDYKEVTDAKNEKKKIKLFSRKKTKKTNNDEDK